MWQEHVTWGTEGDPSRHGGRKIFFLNYNNATKGVYFYCICVQNDAQSTVWLENVTFFSSAGKGKGPGSQTAGATLDEQVEEHREAEIQKPRGEEQRHHRQSFVWLQTRPGQLCVFF